MDPSRRRALFDEWLEAHTGLLVRIVRAYAFTAHDRDDLFQEIALQLWDSIPRFRGESRGSTWIYRVALYSAMGWSQRERTHRDASRALGAQELLVARPEIEPDPRLEWIYAAIARLDPVERSLVLLHLDGLTYREIAATLGLGESHVGVKLNRIKRALSLCTPEEVRNGL